METIKSKINGIDAITDAAMLWPGSEMFMPSIKVTISSAKRDA